MRLVLESTGSTEEAFVRMAQILHSAVLLLFGALATMVRGSEVELISAAFALEEAAKGRSTTPVLSGARVGRRGDRGVAATV